ncbi:MAG: hypothetical protein ACK56F_12340 [bacterium]
MDPRVVRYRAASSSGDTSRIDSGCRPLKGYHVASPEASDFRGISEAVAAVIRSH